MRGVWGIMNLATVIDQPLLRTKPSVRLYKIKFPYFVVQVAIHGFALMPIIVQIFGRTAVIIELIDDIGIVTLRQIILSITVANIAKSL